MLVEVSRNVLKIRVRSRQHHFFFLQLVDHLHFFEWWSTCEEVEEEWGVMMNNMKASGIGYIMRTQTNRKRLLHHEEVGCPSVPNLVAGGTRVGCIINGWWWLFKGGFGECSIQGQRWDRYIDPVLSLVEGVDLERK
jgi:hypothetical protein